MARPRSTHCKRGHELEGNRKMTADGYSDGCAECRRTDWTRYEETWSQKKSKWLKSEYGITLDDYFQMMDEQDGKCAICEIAFDQLPPKHTHVDHCHDTGVVRGLLCHHCNTGLGNLRDSVDILAKAIQYLNKN
jgi:hypothetical protein